MAAGSATVAAAAYDALKNQRCRREELGLLKLSSGKLPLACIIPTAGEGAFTDPNLGRWEEIRPTLGSPNVVLKEVGLYVYFNDTEEKYETALLTAGLDFAPDGTRAFLSIRYFSAAAPGPYGEGCGKEVRLTLLPYQDADVCNILTSDPPPYPASPGFGVINASFDASGVGEVEILWPSGGSAAIPMTQL